MDTVIEAKRSLAGWQPIETAPKDGTKVLLFIPSWRHQPVQIGHYIDSAELRYGKIEREHRYWFAGITFDLGNPKPTHWMPLPEAPQ